MLFAARSLCLHFALPHPSVEDILTATGATRSRAYELCAALIALLPILTRPRGRPAAQPNAASTPACEADGLTAAVLSYVLQHPGCARARGQRHGYSDDFRHFIVQLRAEHADFAIEDFSRRCSIPLGTLKPWLAQPHLEPTSPPAAASNGDALATQTHEHSAAFAQIETVLAEWKTWHGSFIDFAEYVRHQLRVPMGRQFIAHILEAHGVRLPRKRQGRSPDELALRGAFETFFPGAQWVGDGMAVRVVVGGESFTFNLQLDVDAHTSAWVGLSVRDTEDSAAVIESFEHGVATTGSAPLTQLLDNKACNHTPEVEAALTSSGTLRMRSTLGRAQNKAHVEGAFGLFSQQVPPIALDTRNSKRSVAQALLLLVSMTFARGITHRPRADRGGLSRFELYADKPTDEQIQQARRTLEERQRKQELARATLEARQRPEVRALLNEHFARLGLLDSERQIRLAIARYPFGAIVDGIAIFTGKRRASTVPECDEARYLLGIVRNLAAQREGECIAETLLAHRLEAHDRVLAMLEVERAHVCQASRAAIDVITDCIARALDTDRKLDRLFWLGALTSEVQRRALAAAQRDALFGVAARVINTTFRIPPRERQDALLFIANRMVPLN